MAPHSCLVALACQAWDMYPFHFEPSPPPPPKAPPPWAHVERLMPPNKAPPWAQPKLPPSVVMYCNQSFHRGPLLPWAHLEYYMRARGQHTAQRRLCDEYRLAEWAVRLLERDAQVLAWQARKSKIISRAMRAIGDRDSATARSSRPPAASE